MSITVGFTKFNHFFFFLHFDSIFKTVEKNRDDTDDLKLVLKNKLRCDIVLTFNSLKKIIRTYPLKYSNILYETIEEEFYRDNSKSDFQRFTR